MSQQGLFFQIVNSERRILNGKPIGSDFPVILLWNQFCSQWNFVRNEDSPRMTLLASPKGLILHGDVFLTYKFMINSLIANVGLLFQQSSTILPSNKVYYRASLEAYGALEQPPLNRDLTLSLEPSNKVFVQHLSHFWLQFRGPNFFVRQLRILLHG